MKHDDENFRISDKGLEPIGDGEQEASAPDAETPAAGKKKIVFLVLVGVVGAAIVGYQFLGGQSPQAASAVTLPGSGLDGASAPNPADVDAVLMHLENPAPDEDVSVARVERLVKKFDGYVREKQIPLTDLHNQPFTCAMALPPAPTAGPAPAATAFASNAAAPVRDEAAETEARRQRIRDLASHLTVGVVMVAGKDRAAMINGRFCRVGDVINRLKVEVIENDTILVSCDGETVPINIMSEAKGKSARSSDGL